MPFFAFLWKFPGRSKKPFPKPEMVRRMPAGHNRDLKYVPQSKRMFSFTPPKSAAAPWK
jgi:hypothetical protein